MPKKIPRPCRKHGCSKTTTHESGYCEVHRHTGWERYQQGKNRHERGYGTQWDKIRKIILLRDNYLCQECLSKGIVKQAATVDHIIPKAQGGTDDESNLQSLCWSCHRYKTARDKF